MAVCKGTACSRRLTLAWLGFGLLFFFYAIRDALSVAIVCMVGETSEHEADTNNSTNSTLNDRDTVTEEKDIQFPWDKTEQSIVLSMYFIGFCLSTFLGLWLLKHNIIRYYMGGGLFICSIAALLLPFCMGVDIRLIYPLRIVMGMSSAVFFPGLQSMWGRWAPQKELNKLVTISSSGRFLGTAFVFCVTGLLCSTREDGWKLIFYICGGGALVWFFVWQLLTSHNPFTDTRITPAERNFITSNLAINYDQKVRVPWKKLLLSRPVWGCLIIHMMCDWLDFTITTLGPTYMHEVLNFKIAQNGVLSAIPLIFRTISTILVGQLGNLIIQRKLLSIKLTRILFQVIATVGSSLGLVGLGFVPRDQRALAIFLMTCTFCFQAFSESSYQVNEVEIAPRYSGLISGMGNTLSGVAGFLAPIMAGAMTPNKTQAEWRTSFVVLVGLMMFGLMIYLIFLDVKVQPWAKEIPIPGTISTVAKFGTDADDVKKRTSEDLQTGTPEQNAPKTPAENETETPEKISTGTRGTIQTY